VKALVLGGAGESGRYLVDAIAGAESIDSVVVADLDVERARAVAARHAGLDVTAAEVDLHDSRRLVELASAADCVVNCTAFRFFDSVFGAAVEAGADYLDLISEPTDAQRDAAERAGITAIAGVGKGPGTSNMVCAHAAASMDEPLEFHINFAVYRTIAPSPGLLDTILWELSGDCPTRQYYANDRFIWAPPLESSRLVDFPRPVGPQRAYVVPHPETVSLARNYPSLRFVAVRGTWHPTLMSDIEVLNRYGLLDSATVGPDGMPIFEAVRERIWQTHGGDRLAVGEWASVNVYETIGRRDGELVQRDYRFEHDPMGTDLIGFLTGVNAAAAVRLFARGARPPAPGFTDPELCFDPDEYLAELKTWPQMRITWNEHEIATGPKRRLLSDR
jgi:saccharopine dehydrogenase-like NADP-dependent oxidoreductase